MTKFYILNPQDNYVRYVHLELRFGPGIVIQFFLRVV